MSGTCGGGDKMLTARVILEPRSWADAMSVLRAEDLRGFKAQDIRGRKTIQIQAGGEVTMISVRMWVPTNAGGHVLNKALVITVQLGLSV